MAPAGSVPISDGAMSETRTAAGMCFIQAATKPVRGRRSASRRPPARMEKVTSVMPMMVIRASSEIDTCPALPCLDDRPSEAAEQPADDDVPIAVGEQPGGGNGRQRGDQPGDEVALAPPHA